MAASLDQAFAGVTISKAADTSGALSTATCANPAGVTVWRFTVSGDMASLPASVFAELDDALDFSGAVADAAGNRAPFTVSLGLTRKLWRATPAGAASLLTLGPKVFASGDGGTSAFDPASGARTVWDARGSGAASLATNAGTPALVFATAKGVSALFGPGGGNSCVQGDTVTGFGLVDQSTAAFSSESLVWDNTCDPSCMREQQCAPSECGLCKLCWNLEPKSFTSRVILSGTSVTCSPGPGPAATCAGSPDGPASLSNRVSTALPAARWLGENAAGAWAFTDAAGTELGSYGASLFSIPEWPLVDASSPPRAYLPGVFATAGRIDVVELGVGGFGATLMRLDGFPNVITDMQLSAGGILYVLSGGAVHAVIVDSAGSGTAAGGPQTGAWPSRCHDPCRSSLAGYVCPY